MWHRHARALLALRVALLAHQGELLLHLVDALARQPPVDLDLFLALATRRRRAALATTRTTALPVEVTPHPRQARQRIFHARQLHLQARLPGLRAH